MSLLWVLVIILLVFAVLGAPGIGPWQHSAGYAPSGLITLIVIVLIVLLVTGRL